MLKHHERRLLSDKCYEIKSLNGRDRMTCRTNTKALLKRLKMAELRESNRPVTRKALGAQGGNRTRDLRITSALLYRLSYLGANGNASAAEPNGLP